MKKYFELYLIIITVLTVSCSGEDCYDPQGLGGRGPMMQMHYGYGGMFMWIIFLIVIALLIYFIDQARKTKGQTPPQNESPLNILKMRYEKGEITREEYERVKKDLEG